MGTASLEISLNCISSLEMVYNSDQIILFSKICSENMRAVLVLSTNIIVVKVGREILVVKYTSHLVYPKVKE